MNREWQTTEQERDRRRELREIRRRIRRCNQLLVLEGIVLFSLIVALILLWNL